MVRINNNGPHAQTGRARLLPTTVATMARLVAAPLAAALMAGCSALGSSDDKQRISAGNPVVVDRFTAQNPEELSAGTHSDYTTSVPQVGAATTGGIAIRDDNPGIYTVVSGDTLWDISARFLTDAWQWPKVWKANPEIKNPHLIYPGDQIALRYDANGVPSLVVSRNGEEISDNTVYSGSGGGTEKLSPRIREESLKDAIPSIPGDAIRQFLAYPRVVSRRELEKAPYVVGNNEGRLQSSLGQQIYARGQLNPAAQSYAIFRRNKALRDPVSNELLGHEITHVASAKLVEGGDPSTLLITNNKMETMSGDRLMQPGSGFAQHTYIPRTPAIQGGEGRIVSLVNALSKTGRNQIVVLNLGEDAGIRIGDVLAVERRGGTIRDRYSKRKHSKVAIPNTRTGVVMVFQTYGRVSYALVMESTRPIGPDDIVTEI